MLGSIGVVTMLVGSGLFAVATWRTRSLSRAAAGLLVVGAILVVPGLAGVAGGLVPREVAGLAILATILAFPAGWAALGVSALRLDRAGTVDVQGAAS